jgi:hypothetical protein
MDPIDPGYPHYNCKVTGALGSRNGQAGPRCRGCCETKGRHSAYSIERTRSGDGWGMPGASGDPLSPKPRYMHWATFRTTDWLSFAPPICRMPSGRIIVIPRLIPGVGSTPGFDTSSAVRLHSPPSTVPAGILSRRFRKAHHPGIWPQQLR